MGNKSGNFVVKQLVRSNVKIGNVSHAPRLKVHKPEKKPVSLSIRKNRWRDEYAHNQSFALSNPCSTTKLQRHLNDHEKLIQMSRSLIKEHAIRRIDLFFYLLIAYYRSGLSPDIGHTLLQHGIGRTLFDETNLTQGCHSSLITNLTNEGNRLFNTHFWHNLNATVELPRIVNILDDWLEKQCRPYALEILQKSSKGNITPIIGMDFFLENMRQKLATLEELSLSHYSFFSGNTIPFSLVKLVSSATLSNTYCLQTKTTNEAYIQLLLRLKPDEMESCKASDQEKKIIYERQIMKIQKEIIFNQHESALNSHI